MDEREHACRARLAADGVSTEQSQGAERDAGCTWIAKE